uniref:NADH dehydrogenase subunit 6 n=1 Tax=Craseoa lathetica TaxID=316205 RepID=UPI0026E33E4D|nr:NADH dehydrogenase subunit 6 [Craseoa lathetica]WJJ70141.1 NADH dehydrogenase subunit 6 [Craseoa lathetica]
MFPLINIFIILSISSIIMILISTNQIHAIFWLVIFIILQSSILISLGFILIPLLLIIIYIGAIIVLFLMVIMIIEISETLLINTKPTIIFFCFFSFFIIYELFIIHNNIPVPIVSFIWYLTPFNELSNIAIYFYTHYYYELVLISSLLFIAMIATITLALEINKITKKQKLINQHQRNCSIS